MAIYFIIYFLLSTTALADLFIKKASNKSLLFPLILIGSLVIITAGIRWETGTDWPNYLAYFRRIKQVEFGATGMEVGYELIVRSFNLFSENYTLFLFECALIIVSFTYYTVYKTSPYPAFALFLLLSYSLVGSGFGVRQDLAISITLFSVIFIQQRSFYKFAIVVFIATLIHKSSFVFFPAYFLYNLKWNVLSVLAILVVIIISFYLSDIMIETIGSAVSEHKTEVYMDLGDEAIEDPYTTLLKGLSRRLLFLALLIPAVNYTENGDKDFNGIFNIYVFGIVLYIIFTHLNPIFSRIARPYDIFQILAIPIAYYNASRRYKIILVSIVFVFSVYKFTSMIRSDEGINVPYKTIFTENQI
ncbi:EpsG family protein [Dyadobacter sp. Leaf189]|uniref:EpsG family protein n=1 Tax=Dyadobacter sp. Leaf189 TaxID=1736295 RepID=UPI0006F27B5C|nr:EpsG family protein [Dyadobacter sp. Leaf189]KQS33284.1 hypothetical protein ASG33_04165 [Dyadobacter sp. Leaf189]